MSWLDKIPLPMILIACVTLGLAPFMPEPHIWEKLTLLVNGKLNKPVDLFDFIMHGIPWVFLVLKLARAAR